MMSMIDNLFILFLYESLALRNKQIKTHSDLFNERVVLNYRAPFFLNHRPLKVVLYSPLFVKLLMNAFNCKHRWTHYTQVSIELLSCTSSPHKQVKCVKYTTFVHSDRWITWPEAVLIIYSPCPLDQIGHTRHVRVLLSSHARDLFNVMWRRV